MNEKVPHEPITESLLYEWGYIQTGGYYLNWNGMWLLKTDKGWDYGDPNYHRVDEKHPFVKHGEVTYLDELDELQHRDVGRGLEHIKTQLGI